MHILNFSERFLCWTFSYLADRRHSVQIDSNISNILYANFGAPQGSILGAITELKKSVGWTIDKFRLNNFLVINDTILRFSYRKINVQRCMFSNFWDFYCCKHQVIAV